MPTHRHGGLKNPSATAEGSAKALLLFPLPGRFLRGAPALLANVAFRPSLLVLLFSPPQIIRNAPMNDFIAYFEIVLKNVSRFCHVYPLLKNRPTGFANIDLL
jgi:hypothetical protein